MKTSFNFENYRNNLSNEIKKERKEGMHDDARKTLETARSTNEYKISEKLKSWKHESTPRYPKNMEIIDISNILPEEIKLYIDFKRLKAAGISIPDVERNNELINNFLDKVTNNAFTSKDRMTHVINAVGNERGQKATLKENTLNESDEISFGKIPSKQKLFVSSGGSDWYSPDKTLVILNPKSRKFKDNITLPITLDPQNEKFPSDFYRPGEHFDKEEIKKNGVSLDEILNKASEEKTTGVQIKMNRSETGHDWLDIAEYIVSLRDGKVYHFND